MYIIERMGDISGKSIHNSLTDALLYLDKEFPKDEDGYRYSPDPEDDRILIWEVLDTGHRKVVWHFSGWHWDFSAEDVIGVGLEQGKLLGDTNCLYDEVQR